jgi:hypothetical protein
MMIFDVFFYTVYRFLSRKLHRNKADAKHSAFASLCFYISFFVNVLACIVGLIKNNNVSKLFIYKDFLLYVIVAALSYIIFAIRYYKFVDVEGVEKKILAQSKHKQKFFRYITYFLLIAVPVGGFVFYRLYKFGYV